MIRETFPVGPLQCNCTILGDEVSREAIVVDPGDDIPRILAIVNRHGLTIKRVLITHAHIDHIAGAATLKSLTGAPVFYHQNDLAMVKIMDVQARWLGVATPQVDAPDGDLPDAASFSVTGIEGSIIHTPGHTPGSICLYLPQEGILLAGDTLFAGSVGRTDLPGGNGRTLIDSIKSKLMPLPDTTAVIAGHGSATTIGQERYSNPFL